MNVTPGQVLYIYVGGQNAFNGGGLAGSSGTNTSGNGGDASDVRLSGTALTNRMIVAAGGGGGTGGPQGSCVGGPGGNGGDGGSTLGSNGTSKRLWYRWCRWHWSESKCRRNRKGLETLTAAAVEERV